MDGRVISDFNSTISLLRSEADRGGGAPGPKFSQFHAVFRKVWQNHMLTTPWRIGVPGGLAPLLRGILDPPLEVLFKERTRLDALFLSFQNGTMIFSADMVNEQGEVQVGHG